MKMIALGKLLGEAETTPIITLVIRAALLRKSVPPTH
jgi:hypothetical protein